MVDKADRLKGAQEFELSPGRWVAIRELRSEEFEQVIRGVANDANKDYELVSQGLRYALVRDGKEELTYQQLAGPLLAQRFHRPVEMMMLRDAFQKLHLPGPEEQARVKAMRAVSS